VQSDSIAMIEDAVRRVLDTYKPSPWFDSDGAANYLSCSAGTLKTWRARGEGPRFHVIQNKLIRYHIDALDAFVRGEAVQ